MKKFTADFETSTWQENESFVWAWAVCEIGCEKFHLGNSIDSFIEFCKNSNNSDFYFHNLKFDGSFILCYLLSHGFEYVKTSKERKTKSFTALITDMGIFYQITIYFEVKNKKVKKATFYDSLKIIPMSVKQIAKSFNLPIDKLEIDYFKPREEGHLLTIEEMQYIKHDVLIVAKALKVLFDEKLTHMTQGSNALNDYKEILSKRRFEHFFPQLEPDIDEDIRRAYKGGFTFLNPEYKETDVKDGVVLDVNSLYPSQMMVRELPFGEPVYFSGRYKPDKTYTLYIQMLTCSFEIKKNHIPTIQIKHSPFYEGTEYLESSQNMEGGIVNLVLTSVDLELFFEQYDVKVYSYDGGYMFKSTQGLFTEYISKWIERKNQATIEGNKGQRTLAKLMLNSLYGKFATSLQAQQKKPVLIDGVLHFQDMEEESKKGLYIPVACFITAYARSVTIRTSQKIVDYSLSKYGVNKYIYSDTDSIHCLLPKEELEQFCDIDDVKFGAWKCEGRFLFGKFVRQKTYIEKIIIKMNKEKSLNKHLKVKSFSSIKGKFYATEVKITCAGMPQSCYKNVTWTKFKSGFSCGGKLVFKNVKRWCKAS